MKEIRIQVIAHEQEEGITLALPNVQITPPTLLSAVHKLSKAAHQAEMQACEELFPRLVEAIQNMATPQVKIVGPTGKALVPKLRKSPPPNPKKKSKKGRK